MSEIVHADGVSDPPADRIVSDVPCPFCACLCDDLVLTISGGRIVAATNACPTAQAQFSAVGGESTAELTRIGGQPAALDEAIRRVAKILRAARYPLIWGLGRATCEAQTAAIEIAEQTHGVIDTSGFGGAEQATLDALQTIGEIGCTLGEIRSRADLILVWHTNPATDHPRFFERYAPASLGKPGGCRLLAVDSRPTATAALAQRHLQIRGGCEFEAATILWALAKRRALDPIQVDRQTGIALADWNELLTSIERASYAVILYGHDDTAPSHLPPLYGFVRTLNERMRCVSLRLAKVSNSNGTEQAFAWRTGFARCVDFSHGYPRFSPTDFAADRLLARGEVDAAILICDDPQSRLSSEAQTRLRQIPTVSIDWKPAALWTGAEVSIGVAVPGVQSGGTMFRMDGVPLALRPALPVSPAAALRPAKPAKVSSIGADFEVLRMLRSALSSGGK